MEKLDESRLVKRVYKGECVGNKRRGRPRTKWIKSVEFWLEERNLDLVEARLVNKNESRQYAPVTIALYETLGWISFGGTGSQWYWGVG